MFTLKDNTYSVKREVFAFPRVRTFFTTKIENYLFHFSKHSNFASKTLVVDV